MSQSFPSNLLLENTHAKAYRPRGIRTDREPVLPKNKNKIKRQQYIKCFFFNETNPKDVFCGLQIILPGITFDQDMFWFESLISSVSFEIENDLFCNSFSCEKRGL